MTETISKALTKEGFANVRSFEEITQRFVEIAKSLMCSHELVYGERERVWRITAAELYLNTADGSAVWRDPYTHRNPAQLDSGTWYVHDDGRRAPFYSGIDITCGSVGVYGGLLIRELCSEHRWVFQRIVRGKNVNRERKDNTWTQDEKKLIGEAIHRQPIGSGLLKLVKIPWQDQQLFIGQRIGLKKKSDADISNSERELYRTASLRIATSQTACLKTSMKPLPLSDAKL